MGIIEISTDVIENLDKNNLAKSSDSFENWISPSNQYLKLSNQN